MLQERPMTKAKIYRLAPTKGRLVDASLEFERMSDVSSAVILHSRSGGPPRNNEYPEALSRIIERLHEQDRVTAVLIDSSRHAHLPRQQRLLFTGMQLAWLSADEATRSIRQSLLRFGQKEGAKGGNSTKRVRIETSFPFHSLIASLNARRAGDVGGSSPRSSKSVSRKKALKLIERISCTDEELRCVENEVRMVTHFRAERSRSSQLPKQKRAIVLAANNDRYVCEGKDCPVDWYSVFAKSIADGVFEVHHRVPLSSYDEPVINSIDDLQILCASCHRAEHRRLALL